MIVSVLYQSGCAEKALFFHDLRYSENLHPFVTVALVLLRTGVVRRLTHHLCRFFQANEPGQVRQVIDRPRAFQVSNIGRSDVSALHAGYYLAHIATIEVAIHHAVHALVPRLLSRETAYTFHIPVFKLNRILPEQAFGGINAVRYPVVM